MARGKKGTRGRQIYVKPPGETSGPPGPLPTQEPSQGGRERSSAPRLHSPSSFSGLLPQLNRRGNQTVYAHHQPCWVIHLSEGEHPGRTRLDTRTAANTLGIFHRKTFVGEVHDIDSLVAHRCADVAGDALLLVRENSKLAESSVDVHQRSQWACEPTPNAPAEPEVCP